jgi:hypothetical protein
MRPSVNWKLVHSLGGGANWQRNSITQTLPDKHHHRQSDRQAQLDYSLQASVATPLLDATRALAVSNRSHSRIRKYFPPAEQMVRTSS